MYEKLPPRLLPVFDRTYDTVSSRARRVVVPERPLSCIILSPVLVSHQYCSIRYETSTRTFNTSSTIGAEGFNTLSTVAGDLILLSSIVPFCVEP